MADNTKNSASRESLEILLEISNLLNTGLDADTLAVCVRLCEMGVNPDALALVIQELKRETTALKEAGAGEQSASVLR